MRKNLFAEPWKQLIYFDQKYGQSASNQRANGCVCFTCNFIRHHESDPNFSIYRKQNLSDRMNSNEAGLFC
jgi:hypothetical protein